LDTEEQSRSEADGQAWKEDMQWARILDQEWDLQAVKQVSYGSVISLNWFSYCVRASCRGM